MEYVVYIDIVFLTDLYLDFLALLLTSAFLRQRPSIVRLTLAAMAGAGWTCFLIVCPILSEALELLLTVLVVGSVMNGIVYYPRESIFHIGRFLERNVDGRLCVEGTWRMSETVMELLRADISLLIASAVLNGCLSFTREHFYLSDWECLAFMGAMSGTVVIFLREIMKKQKIGTERYAVSLFLNGNQREFTGLVDSGNRLRVPESGKVVSLISYRDCIGFCDKVSGGFFIPYRAVGTEHGLLFAITFEKMEIRKSGTCIKIENPVVAITKEPLSIGGDFNMILPEEYVLNSENGF